MMVEQVALSHFADEEPEPQRLECSVNIIEIVSRVRNSYTKFKTLF